MTASFEDARRMTGDDVRSFGFEETRGFSRGYDESGVDSFVTRVADEIDERDRLIEASRQEIEHLRKRILQANPDRIAQSVDVLSRAQRTADETVARADQHSARVMSEARTYFDDARRQAAKIVDEAARQAEDMANLAAADHGEMARQTTYLQTLRDVTRTQIEAFLMALYDRVAEEYSQVNPAVAAEVAAQAHEKRPRPPAPATTAVPAAAEQTNGPVAQSSAAAPVGGSRQ